MQKIISLFQFVTYQNIEKSASQQALEFCAGGGDWVQLRIKDMPNQYILQQAQECFSICQSYGATLIINDNPELAAQIDADGVHLGKNDMSIKDARSILGEHKIIGATANSFDDINSLVKQGVDYIGLGPFKLTNTKSNLSPVLGISGYTQILKQCQINNLDIPIIAIGGITPNDFDNLYEAGIHGIALSSYLAKQENIGKETLNILSEIGKAHSSSYNVIF